MGLRSSNRSRRPSVYRYQRQTLQRKLTAGLECLESRHLLALSPSGMILPEFTPQAGQLVGGEVVSNDEYHFVGMPYVDASGSSIVQVFDADTNQLVQTLSQPYRTFGQDLAVTDSTLAVRSETAVHVYEIGNERLNYRGSVGAPEPGRDPEWRGDLGLYGDLLVVGDYTRRQVFVFDLQHETIRLATTLSAPDLEPRQSSTFGLSVAVDAERILVGDEYRVEAGYTGHVYVYETVSGDFELLQTLTHPSERHRSDRFGASISIDEGLAIIAVSNARQWSSPPRAFVYDASAEQLELQATFDSLAAGRNPGPVHVSQVGTRFAFGVREWSGNEDLFLLEVVGNTVRTLQQVPEEYDAWASFELHENQLRVVAEDADTIAPGVGIVYELVVGDNELTDVTTLSAAIASAGGAFGTSVDVASDRIIVGSPSYRPVPGDPIGRVELMWADDPDQRLIIDNPEPETNFLFGHRVAIHGDVIAVASQREGTNPGTFVGNVFVYQLLDDNRVELITNIDAYGYSLTLTDRVLAIGTFGSARVYGIQSDRLEEWAVLRRPDDGVGFSSYGRALDVDGNTLVVRDSNQEMLYVYRIEDGRVTLTTEFEVLGRSEGGIAIDGNVVVIGSVRDTSDGSVRVFDIDHDQVTFRERIRAPGYNRPPTPWDEVGHAVALDDGTLVIGDPRAAAFDRGSALVYDVSRSPAVLQGIIDPPSELAFGRFGAAVAIDGSRAWITAQEDDTQNSDQGAVYVYDLSPPTASAGGPYTVPEGTDLKLDATASADGEQGWQELTFEWDLDYDGVHFVPDAGGAEASVRFADDFPRRAVALRVTDSDGEQDLAFTTLEVLNANPVVSIGEDVVVREQELVHFDATRVTDLGREDILRLIWDFGDASARVVDTDSPSHVYHSPGTYTVTLTVTDDDGGTTSDTLRVFVKDDDSGLERLDELTAIDRLPSLIGADSVTANSRFIVSTVSHYVGWLDVFDRQSFEHVQSIQSPIPTRRIGFGSMPRLADDRLAVFSRHQGVYLYDFSGDRGVLHQTLAPFGESDRNFLYSAIDISDRWLVVANSSTVLLYSFEDDRANLIGRVPGFSYDRVVRVLLSGDQLVVGVVNQRYSDRHTHKFHVFDLSGSGAVHRETVVPPDETGRGSGWLSTVSDSSVIWRANNELFLYDLDGPAAISDSFKTLVMPDEGLPYRVIMDDERMLVFVRRPDLTTGIEAFELIDGEAVHRRTILRTESENGAVGAGLLHDGDLLLGVPTRLDPDDVFDHEYQLAAYEIEPDFTLNEMGSMSVPTRHYGNEFGATLAVDDRFVAIQQAGRSRVDVYHADNLVEPFVRIESPNGGGDFGGALAISDDLLVIGAPDETIQRGRFTVTVGAVYAYRLTNEGAALLFRIQGETGSRLGNTIQLVNDLMIVGDRGGTVRIYRVEGETFTELRSITAPHEDTGEFGMAIVATGRWLFVSDSQYRVEPARNRGIVYAYDLVDGGAPLTLPNDGAISNFGHHLASDGEHLVVAANYAFALYDITGPSPVFVSQVSGQHWRRDFRVAVDGGRVLVAPPRLPSGSERGGGFHLYEVNGLEPTHLATRIAPSGHDNDQFGDSIAIHGDVIWVGAPGDDFVNFDQGAVYRYRIREPRETRLAIRRSGDAPVLLQASNRFSVEHESVGEGAQAYRWSIQSTDGDVIHEANGLLGAGVNQVPAFEFVPQSTGHHEALLQIDYGAYQLEARFPFIVFPTGQCEIGPLCNADLIDHVYALARVDFVDRRYDFNNDSVSDREDAELLVASIMQTTPGDSNLDGVFDSSDLVLAFAGGKYDDASSDAGWAAGDWNGDGRFDSTDLIWAFQIGSYI